MVELIGSLRATIDHLEKETASVYDRLGRIDNVNNPRVADPERPIVCLCDQLSAFTDRIAKVSAYVQEMNERLYKLLG